MDQNEILEKLIKMKKIIVKINKMLDPKIENLNYTDIFVFMKITNEEGITMKKLSEITGFSSTLITFTVDELERHNLVERKKGGDRRSTKVVLSDKGKMIKNEIRTITIEKFKNIMKNLNENEKEELIELFDKIFKILEKIE